MRMTRGRATLITVAALAGGFAAVVSVSRSETQVQSSGRSPAELTAGMSSTRHFEYVASVGAIYVYSIDRSNHLVQTIRLPQTGSSIQACTPGSLRPSVTQPSWQRRSQ